MSNPTLVPIRYQKIEARPMGIREFMGLIMRRKAVILGVVLPILLFSSYATFTATDMVTASSRVFVESRRPEDPTFLRLSVDFDVLMSTSMQVAMSIPIAESAAAAIWDSISTLKEENLDLAMVHNEQDLRDLLLENLDCSTVGESNILRITYASATPEFALMAVGAITRSYIAESAEIRQNKTAVSYYSDQINQVQSGIDSLLDERAIVMADAGYLAFKENAIATATQISLLERDYFDTRAERVALEKRYDLVLEAVKQDPGFLPELYTGRNTSMLNLKRILAGQQVKLAELLVKHNEDTEWVIGQQSLIEDTEKQITAERDRYLEEMRISCQELRSEEDDLLKSVSDQQFQLSQFPLIEKRTKTIDISMDTQMDLLEILQTKRGEVRLKAATDARVSNIVMLDKPSIDAKIGGGKRAIYLVLSGFFGIAIGIIAALFIDRGDHRLYNTHQVQEYLGVSVLGSISDATAIRK